MQFHSAIPPQMMIYAMQYRKMSWKKLGKNYYTVIEVDRDNYINI